MNRSNKMGLMFLGGLALIMAILIVGENDYEDQLIMTHYKCTDYPMLRECRDYDPSEYYAYMMEKNGDH